MTSNRDGVGYNRPISRYILKTVQDRDIVTMYETLIGTRMRSIEWCYFQ